MHSALRMSLFVPSFFIFESLIFASELTVIPTSSSWSSGTSACARLQLHGLHALVAVAAGRDTDQKAPEQCTHDALVDSSHGNPLYLRYSSQSFSFRTGSVSFSAAS